MPDNGSEWRKFRIVPRSHPLRPLVLYFVENFKGVEAEELLDYQGRAGIISIARWNFRPGPLQCRKMLDPIQIESLGEMFGIA